MAGCPRWLIDDEKTASVHHRPARTGHLAPWPAWVSDTVRQAWQRQGVDTLWAHQATAAEAIWQGRHTALATGTSSGKTLAYLLPIIAATVENKAGWTPPPTMAARAAALRLDLPVRHTALYVAPTKALAHDQLRACTDLDVPNWNVTTLDGDSAAEERRFARDFATYVLTNPDMLHRSVLPHHQRWSRFLGDLRYVVIDEAHRYKGVFGAHVAAVLRRLRRLCRFYGADPTFVLASATISDADSVGQALTGVETITVIDQDDSPAPALDFVLRHPTPSLTQDAATLLAQLSRTGQVLAFTTSRVQAELVAIRARELVADPDTIASYRGGYLAGDRRTIEAELQEGRLRAVASTNALELGVDISGVDAVVHVGFPGTLAALWQQAGRAGRAGRDALAVLVAREDPLDAYLVEHPELIFDRPIERTIIGVDNPYVWGPHLAAAAQERPLTEADEEFFGPQTVPLAEQLAKQGLLRRRQHGWFWVHPQRAVDSIDIRAIQGRAVDIVEAATGRVLGHVDPTAIDRTLHPEAIYVHQGEQWLVLELNEPDSIALVQRIDATWFTQPQSVSDIRVVTTERSRRLGRGMVHVGMVEMSGQVTGYLRRDERTGEVWDSTALEMPQRRMITKAVWWTLPDDVIATLNIEPSELPGAVHGAEHTAIGLLPAFVPCDRWDIGGLSTVLHPDTGKLTVFVHDGLPGGAGFAEQGFDCAEQWWEATWQRLQQCPCAEGCPACVVSPKCGSGNKPLHKQGAAVLVSALLD